MTDARKITVGVVGAGTMGRGIAQVAAQQGHPVVLVDSDARALATARESLEKILARQVGKGRMTREEMDGLLARIRLTERPEDASSAGLVIEAIVEDLAIKQELFRQLESLVPGDCLLATNTSSLPVVAIASACETPGRCVGVHFFNPAPLMPLVEVVPGLTTDPATVDSARSIVESWGKTAV
ncbi:MAG: 3-hydroxyacyl-CoA dehydrogenase NAD-binding domain-containing protein, partial [Acidobacteriota bacterium]|nr:3-hydroxyacyl-CoA dehydrogenase NAD-binding domain-containing protein [Acidobacteriota bacterium]